MHPSRLFMPPNLLMLLGRPIHSLGLLKSPANRLDTAPHQAQGNSDPKGIAQHKVCPVVVSLRARVGNAIHKLIVEANDVVQNVTVELAHADEQLKRMSPGVVSNGGVGDEEGQWAPEESSDGLHAHDKGILGHVARVRERVLLPELAEEVVFAGHVEVVVGKVA